jgi:hypothetical protein
VGAEDSVVGPEHWVAASLVLRLFRRLRAVEHIYEILYPEYSG